MNGVTPMFGTGRNYAPSPAIWGDCPINKLRDDPGEGFFIHEDWRHFTGFGATVGQATTVVAGGYKGIWDTGGTILHAPLGESNDYPGVYWPIRLSSDGTDNDEQTLIFGGAAGAGTGCAPFLFETGKKLWWEACISLGEITDAVQSRFFGLASEEAGVADFLNDDGAAIVASDTVGFKIDVTDGDALDLAFSTATTAFTAVDNTDLVPYAVSASTWYRCGMKCDGTTCFFYIEGVLVDQVTIATSGFPDSKGLTAIFAQKTHGGATSIELDVAWWRGAMRR